MPHRSIFAPPLPSPSAQQPFADFPLPTSRDLYSPPPADFKKPPNRAKEVQAAVRAATSLSHVPPDHYQTTSSVLLPGFKPSAESTRQSCKFVEKRHKNAKFDHTTTNAILFQAPAVRAASSMEGAVERARPIVPCGQEHLLCDDANVEARPFQSTQQLVEEQRQKELAEMLRDGQCVRLPPFRPKQMLANPLSFEATSGQQGHSRRKSFRSSATNTSHSSMGDTQPTPMCSSYQAQFSAKRAEPVGRVVHTVAFLRKLQDMQAVNMELPEEQKATRYFTTTNQELLYKFAVKEKSAPL